MIPIPGRLTVREISGRKGMFVVGDLVTEIGTFKVKDTILDQFEPGVYTGTFMVLNIYPDSYVWQGRVTTEIRAKVHEIRLDHEEKDVPAGGETPSEPDPAMMTEKAVEAQPTTAVVAPAPASVPPPAEPEAPGAVPDAPSTPATEGEEGNPDQELFGPEIFRAVQTSAPVKLDPTIDRNQFRAQRDRLKTLGFTFDAMTQSWQKKD